MAKQSNAAPQKRGFFARLFGRREAVPKTARRSFAGARPVGSLASWQPQNWSADALARSDLDRLRARARSLARDNDYMRKFLNMVESNVIGRDGFALQMRVLLDNADKPDALANKAIEAAFSRWARRGVCDVTGQMSFTDLQRLLILPFRFQMWLFGMATRIVEFLSAAGLLGLGGNQGNAVSIVPFNLADIDGYYWPSKLVDGKPIPSMPSPERYDLPVTTATAAAGVSEA